MIEQNIHLNGIYQHYKGNFYRVVCVAYNHDDNTKALVIYHRCDENGIFISIRYNSPSFNNDDNKAIIVGQPFYRDIEEFLEVLPSGYNYGTLKIPNYLKNDTPRFKFIKQL